MRLPPLVLRAGAALLAFRAVPLDAQPPPRADSPRTPLLTLATWADDVWLALLDRDGAFHGRLAPEGTFQRFNALMDDEYELDVRAGRFSATEDARWHAAGNGFRVAGASINHPFILNYADWRQDARVAGPVDFQIRYTRHRSLTMQRDYTRIGAAWRNVANTGWTARAALGLHFFKPSADVELGIGRTWERDGTAWRLEITAALLDAFNDLIFNTLGVQPDEAPAHFDYATVPLAGRVALAHRRPGFGAELHAGASTDSRVRVTFPATGDAAYTLAERLRYAGGLVEARLARVFRVALYAMVATASTAHTGNPSGAGDFRLTETTRTAGARAARDLGGAWAVDLDLRARWRPERREGGGGPVNHEDRETFGQAALTREPATGWRWRVGYQLMDRTAGEAAPGLTATNHRALTEAGYRFASGFELMGGVRWRVDRLTSSAFAGGHLRIAAAW